MDLEPTVRWVRLGPAGSDWVRLAPTGSRKSNSRRGEIEGAKGEGATEEEAICLFLPGAFLASPFLLLSQRAKEGAKIGGAEI